MIASANGLDPYFGANSFTNRPNVVPGVNKNRKPPQRYLGSQRPGSGRQRTQSQCLEHSPLRLLLEMLPGLMVMPAVPVLQ